MCRSVLLAALLFVIFTSKVTATCTAFTYSVASDSIVSQTNSGTAYYIDFVGGNDANAGTSTGSPWKHHPFGKGWTGTYTHHSGDCFYFKGGVTWDSTNWEFSISSGGGVGNEDYYGPDPTNSWFTGASWSRPIFDLGAAVLPSGNAHMFNYLSDNVIADNFEIIRAYCDPTHNFNVFSVNAHSNVPVLRMYQHNTQAPLTGCGGPSATEITTIASGGSPTAIGPFAFNVMDGSDGNKGYVAWEVVRNSLGGIRVVHNIIHDVCSAVNFTGDGLPIAYNLIYNVGTWGGENFNCTPSGPYGATGFHPDGIQVLGNADIHDNILHDTTGETVNVVPTAAGSNIYNNIFYSNIPIAILIGNVGQADTAGVVTVYNNTCQTTIGCFRMGSAPLGTLTIKNNHNITSDGSSGICINNPPFNNAGCGSATSFTYTASSELYQTLAQANAAGYSSTQTFVYSPTSPTSPTVGIGTNLTNLCTTTFLLCTDTTDGSKLGSGNTAVPNRSPIARPSGVANWDAGAYQFSQPAVNVILSNGRISGVGVIKTHP